MLDFNNFASDRGKQLAPPSTDTGDEEVQIRPASLRDLEIRERFKCGKPVSLGNYIRECQKY